ncbi:MAG: protease inhibitor I9 family protein, partial [Woeseiaceae bacterium]
MNTHSIRAFAVVGLSLIGTLGIALTSTAVSAEGVQLAAEQVRSVREAPTAPRAVKPRSSLDANGRATYIVQLAGEPAAAYRGGIDGLKATSRIATGAARFDAKSPESLAYTRHLETVQQSLVDATERSIGRSVAIPFTYQHAFNGLAMKLTASEATKVARLPGV